MEEIMIMELITKKISAERRAKRPNLRYLRDRKDPFTLDENIFQKLFRFPKTLCWDLIMELKAHDEQKTKLPFELRFISVLYFLCKGSFQSNIENEYFDCMSQSSVSRSINYICNLILQVKGSEVEFPKTPEQYKVIKAGFYNKFNMKGVIGVIDCTHIAIIAPKASDTLIDPNDYKNDNGYYSINVEAICDHELVFRHLNTKFPGSCIDYDIWLTSPARITLLNEFRTNEFKWLLGDSNYPLEPWLLIPFTNPNSTKAALYNSIHLNAQNTMQKAFGVLKSRFRCINKDRPLRYGHKSTGLIISACVILHNILQKNGISFDGVINIENNQYSGPHVSNFFTEGIRARHCLMNSIIA